MRGNCWNAYTVHCPFETLVRVCVCVWISEYSARLVYCAGISCKYFGSDGLRLCFIAVYNAIIYCE